MAKKSTADGVYRVTEVIGTSTVSWEDAAKNADVVILATSPGFRPRSARAPRPRRWNGVSVTGECPGRPARTADVIGRIDAPFALALPPQPAAKAPAADTATVVLPRMEGSSTLRLLRRLDRKMPIIAYGEKAHMLSAAGVVCLSGPPAGPDLLSVLRSCLRQAAPRLHEDVDSGPLSFGLTPVATGVSLAAARANGDDEIFERVLQLGETLGLPLTWDGQKRYALGQLVAGDAFEAWGKTIVPWRMGTAVPPPGDYPRLTPRIHVWAYGIALVWSALLLLPFAARRRRERPQER